jgi:hypothetical protein
VGRDGRRQQIVGQFGLAAPTAWASTAPVGYS